MNEEKKNLNKKEMTEEELNKIAGGKFTSDIFLENIRVTKYAYDVVKGHTFACGIKVNQKYTNCVCAVSNDLLKIFPFYSRIIVSEFSEFHQLTVFDTVAGHNRIEIFCLSRKEVSEWGTKFCNVKNVIKLDS